jgi:glycosyltransferase involved in cell wall biosynthesis
MSSSPEISVVIPARDAAGTLGELLESLRGQDLDRDQYEVVVVDNASRDDTAGVAATLGARVVDEPVASRSRARNRGVEEARAELIAFTDADCVASPGWLRGYLECDDSSPLRAGPVLVSTGDPPNRVERFETLWRFGQEAWVKQGWAATANLCVTRAAFQSVGGFDPAYRHIGEDVDFCVRARRAGHALGWCPDAIVSHDTEERIWPLLKRSFFHGYSSGQCWHRIGFGQRAWRDPVPAVAGDRALRQFGASPESFDPEEWRQMLRIARPAHAARVLGSLWGEARRAR